MKFKFITAVLTAAVVFSGCSGVKTADKKAAAEAEETSETVFAMDTAMTLTAYGPNGEKAVSEALTEITRLDSLFSVTDENSDIYRLNSEKEARVSEDTYNIIKEAFFYSEKTEGILNIAVYPAVKAWGFTTGNYRVPGETELDSLKEHIDPSKISFDDETMTVTINDPGGEIDLGSVAKGYTSAKIAEIFEENGVESGILSLGGNVQTIGKKPDGSQWRVAVLNPENQTEYSGIISTERMAVVTSGNYQRFFEENGKLYHHIIDPATCAPSESGLASVTIVAENGLTADAYSTALFIMGEEKAADFWRKNKDEFQAVLITGEGKIYITEGLETSFAPTDKNTRPEIIRAEK